MDLTDKPNPDAAPEASGNDIRESSHGSEELAPPDTALRKRAPLLIKSDLRADDSDSDSEEITPTRNPPAHFLALRGRLPLRLFTIISYYMTQKGAVKYAGICSVPRRTHGNHDLVYPVIWWFVTIKTMMSRWCLLLKGGGVARFASFQALRAVFSTCDVAPSFQTSTLACFRPTDSWDNTMVRRNLRIRTNVPTNSFRSSQGARWSVFVNCIYEVERPRGVVDEGRQNNHGLEVRTGRTIVRLM